MNSSLHLSAVYGHTVAGLKICGTADLCNLSFCVLYDLVALNDVAAHKSNLTVWLHTEELGRRYLCKIISIDVKLSCEGHLACACLGVGRIVGKLKILYLVLGIVGYNNLDGIEYCNAALCSGVKLFSDAVLKKLVIYNAICLCNACARYEIKN